MKNDIRNIFGDGMATSIEGMVSTLDKMDLSIEEILDYIGDMHELTRAGMHLTALSNGNKELADKINKANKYIKLKRIDEFKKSVAKGTYEEFLANMPWTDKSSLLVDMRVFGIGLPSEKNLTEEEQRYFEIIENSINKDIEKEALSQGFDSVEAWRNHNAMHSMGAEVEPQTEMYIPRGIKR
ncbi:MAG: hypothetical protein IJ463_07500 [Bacilli bacterium]|nr:hypothetical protein [Bacilli bacterium]